MTLGKIYTIAIAFCFMYPAAHARGAGRGEGQKPRWPTIEEQLRVLKVKHGSALEQLIKENQDFSMLQPEEANDDLPFPLWLRVYVRKKHPELNFSGPRVGYPLILKEILSYMLRHQDAPTGPPAGTR
jgi:hypothetical protein